MTTSPLVTIVIPTYNYARFVVEAVKSAAAQTYQNTEIILVDDGSTDDTPAKLQSLQREIPNLRVIRTEHQGVSRARNCGTRAGNGLYVAYLDADDIWHPTKVEKQVRAMAEHADDPEWGGVYCLFRPIDENASVVGNAPAFETRGYFFARHLAMNPIGTGSGIMLRRDVILGVGGFNPALSYCEDLDTQLRISKRYKIELVREYLVGYRKHRDSASQHHLEMANAAFGVLGKYASDPTIPKELRKSTYAAAYRYMWYKFLMGGERLKAMSTLVRALVAEPLTTLDSLMIQAAPSVRRRVAYAKRVMMREGDRKAPHFYDLEPMDGVTFSEPPAFARLSAKFGRFDAEMYDQFGIAGSHANIQNSGDGTSGLISRERASPY